MNEELSPATAVVSSSKRCSTPCARRSSQPARRLSAPVRSRPAPRIMVAMMLMTALPEKPLNSSSGSTKPDRPSSTSTTSATTSARMRSNRNIAIVNTTSPRTSFMSVVSARAVSIRAGSREWGMGNRNSKGKSRALRRYLIRRRYFVANVRWLASDSRLPIPYSRLLSYNKSQTPWPSFWPRVSKWVCGRQSGRGTLPRGPARLTSPPVASRTSHICSA